MLRVGGGRGIFARAATAPAGSGAYTPLALFAAGEKGGWYDISDLSSMFQDAAGTTPAAVGQPVGLLQDKSGNGNHLTAAGTARPTLQQDGNGFYYLAHDGIEDTLSTAGNMAVAGGKATLWTGHDREAAGLGWLAQLSTNVGSQDGAFAQYVYGTAFEAALKGNQLGTGTDAASGDGLLLATSQFDLTSNTTAEASNRLRLNGAAVTLSYNASVPSGTDFISARFFIGSQNGTFPFNGRMYSCIVRFAESIAEEIEDTETWLNERMGAY